MKKILVVLAVLFALGSREASAQARVTYYYYPAPNVYYNVSTGDYLYYSPSTTAWVTVKSLPSGITITRSPRYVVYYNGPEVWRDNSNHKIKYKGKKTKVNKTSPAKKPNKN